MKIDGLHFSIVGIIIGILIAEFMRRRAKQS